MEISNKAGVSQIEDFDFQFSLVTFLLAIDGKNGTINEDKPQNGATAQVTITLDDNDFVDLAAGKANAPAVCINIYLCIHKFVSSSLFCSFLQKVK